MKCWDWATSGWNYWRLYHHIHEAFWCNHIHFLREKRELISQDIFLLSLILSNRWQCMAALTASHPDNPGNCVVQFGEELCPVWSDSYHVYTSDCETLNPGSMHRGPMHNMLSKYTRIYYPGNSRSLLSSHQPLTLHWVQRLPLTVWLHRDPPTCLWYLLYFQTPAAYRLIYCTLLKSDCFILYRWLRALSSWLSLREAATVSEMKARDKQLDSTPRSVYTSEWSLEPGTF